MRWFSAKSLRRRAEAKVLTGLDSYQEILGENPLPGFIQLLAEFSSMQL